MISAIGASACIGMDALQVAMLARAHRMVPRSLSQQDARGRSIGACTALGLADDVIGYPRLVALAAASLRQLPPIEQAPPMFVATSSDNAQLCVEVAKAAGYAVDVEASLVFSGGHAAGARAVEAALAYARQGRGRPVIIGGVDSLTQPDVLHRLDVNYRLHARGIEDGFIPGEASAMLLIDPSREANIVHVGVADETADPNIGAAMTELVHAACEVAPVAWVMSDINGERHRVSEWSKVAIRTRLSHVVHQRLPELIGDVGAASLPMMMAIATQWAQVGAVPATRVLCVAHADGPSRGVVLLEVA